MEILFLVGRVLFGGFFVFNGFGHLKNIEATSGYASMKGIPMPKTATVITGLLLVVGGLSMLTGAFTHIGILLLIIFMVPTTYMMHQFWKVTDPMQAMGEKINFAKNVAIIGALLMLLSLAIPWANSLAL